MHIAHSIEHFDAVAAPRRSCSCSGARRPTDGNANPTQTALIYAVSIYNNNIYIILNIRHAIYMCVVWPRKREIRNEKNKVDWTVAAAAARNLIRLFRSNIIILFIAGIINYTKTNLILWYYSLPTHQNVLLFKRLKCSMAVFGPQSKTQWRIWYITYMHTIKSWVYIILWSTLIYKLTK